MKYLLLCALFALAALPSLGQSNEAEVNKVLDNIHRLAAEADFDGYFDLYTPDAIFLGTDAMERWTIEEFKGYAKPSFDRGRGWIYVPTERHVYLSPDGNSAWFDERLDNEGFGECRGSGALIKIDGVWKVTQYNLTVPIPNDLLRNVAGQIKKLKEGN
ncbi:MAG: nuclear transport factor 2 family protein [Bacteroidetes bacterium]|nr:nuclear transport factor 2 family protein [Bacteroidota bacterium]